MNNPFAVLSMLVCIPFLGMLFVLTAKQNNEKEQNNYVNVAIFTVVANIVLLWRIFMLIDEKSAKLQLFEKFAWLNAPEINLMFAVDNTSLMIILALHLAVLTGIVFVRPLVEKTKALMVFTLMFLGFSTGLFVAADIFSFFIFFEAILLPLFMLIGMYGGSKRHERHGRFFLYNLLGTLALFAAVLLIYKFYGSLKLNETSNILWNTNYGWFIWAALLSGFLSRIPIWPFHYWISSIVSNIRNPLVFILSSVLPLSGLYGILRFWPDNIPNVVSQYFVWINIIGVVTMLFISLVSFINKDAQYKIFAFVSVYYIMYLIGIFSQNQTIVGHLGYALFGFLVVFGAYAVLVGYIHHQEELHEANSVGFLCKAKRLSLVYSFLTFAAIGFPVSAMFTNNFLIFSELLDEQIHLGMILMVAIIVVAATLLSEMFRLKTDVRECMLTKAEDISSGYFVYMLFIVFMLLMSFLKPLWFVISE